MRKLAVALLLLAAIGAGVAASAQEQTPVLPSKGDTAPRLQFDGLYYEINPGGETHRYWRFRENSACLISGPVLAPPEQAAPKVATWLDEDQDRVEVGKYTMDGTKFTCVVGDARSSTTYAGVLTTAGFNLVSPDGARSWEYRFVPVAFPAKDPSAPGANRPPRIGERVTKTDAFDYDAAGRMTGVTTTLEITASDPEGDVLTYEWTVSVVKYPVRVRKATWQRPLDMGRPLAGMVTLRATDAKGSSSSRTFNVQ